MRGCRGRTAVGGCCGGEDGGEGGAGGAGAGAGVGGGNAAPRVKPVHPGLKNERLFFCKRSGQIPHAASRV